MADIIRVEGHEFDPEDLTFGEAKEVKRAIRTEFWDEAADGPFDWEEVGENEIIPATILVFMRRHDPHYTVAQALACKSRDVAPDPDTLTCARDDCPTLRLEEGWKRVECGRCARSIDAEKMAAPPTKAAPSKPSSSRRKTPAASGSPS